jgi:hypothetical protein
MIREFVENLERSAESEMRVAVVIGCSCRTMRRRDCPRAVPWTEIRDDPYSVIVNCRIGTNVRMRTVFVTVCDSVCFPKAGRSIMYAEIDIVCNYVEVVFEDVVRVCEKSLKFGT